MASYLSWLTGEPVLRLRIESFYQVTIARLVSWLLPSTQFLPKLGEILKYFVLKKVQLYN